MITAEDKICIQLKDENGSVWVWKSSLPDINISYGDTNVFLGSASRCIHLYNSLTKVVKWHAKAYPNTKLQKIKQALKNLWYAINAKTDTVQKNIVSIN